MLALPRTNCMNQNTCLNFSEMTLGQIVTGHRLLRCKSPSSTSDRGLLKRNVGNESVYEPVHVIRRVLILSSLATLGMTEPLIIPPSFRILNSDLITFLLHSVQNLSKRNHHCGFPYVRTWSYTSGDYFSYGSQGSRCQQLDTYNRLSVDVRTQELYRI